MKLKRAFATLQVKATDSADGKRKFSGIASTISTDRMDDVVVPGGAKFKLPIPLLWQHNSREPIGWVTAVRINGKQISVDCEMHVETEPGKLKDRLDEAWQCIKAGLVQGLSIGFNPIKSARIDGTWGTEFLEWEWLELSAVTIAANVEASITSIKSADDLSLAASGREQEFDDGRDPSAAARGQKPTVSKAVTLLNPRSQKGHEMNIAEQIKALEATRSAKAAAAMTIMSKAATEGRSTDAEEASQYDEIAAEIKKIDSDLERLRSLEKMQLATATTVDTSRVNDPAAAAVVRSGADRGVDIGERGIISVRRNLPKGTSFTRFVQAMARTKGNIFEANHVVSSLCAKGGAWHDTPELVNVMKAASDYGTTTDTDFASKLVYYTNMVDEFVELLRPATILGKFGQNGVPALRRVPMNIRMVTQTGGGTYGWVGEGAAKPVGELTLGEVTLRWAKAAGIIVLSDELVKFSSPSAEEVVRRDMIEGMAQFLDRQFIDPQIAAVANVSPASITNGVTDVPSTGTTADAMRTDVNTLYAKFPAATLNMASGVWIMSQRRAIAISLMRNTLGQKEYPDMTPLGGTFEGFPVIVSENVPDDSAGGMMVFVLANEIFYSDDGPVTIDASREASLQMNTTPDNPTTASTVMVSLWQRNLVGLRAERYANWQKRRAQAVQYISSAAYVD